MLKIEKFGKGFNYAPRNGYRKHQRKKLLVMDIGNTNVKIGVYSDDELLASWRISTEAQRTSDEYGMVLYDLLKNQGISFKDIKGIVMSSVAPSLNYTIEHMCDYYIGIKPTVVDHTTNTGIKINYDNPKELGSDRIVDCAAAYAIYGGPLIVIDFGSATTFNAVTADGEFIGGAIAPGMKTATESLVMTAAKLPRIELNKPESIIATSTKSGMQSGVVYGYTGLVDYMVKNMKKEPKLKNAKVVATGGLSELIENSEVIINVIDRALALKGLKLVYDLNKPTRASEK